MVTQELTRKKWDPAEDKRGLECRKCGCRHFRVLHTRPVANGILRERECRNCGKVVWTREKMG